MKLHLKIWLGVGIVIGLIMALDAVVALRGIQREVRSGLDEDARVVRAVLMATRRVYHLQFMASGVDLNEKTVGFLPAHALGRISSDFPNWTDSALRFNNVSDRARNPANKADQYEVAAMDYFRANRDAKDRVAIFRDDQGRDIYHFTAPMWIEPYCLICHGERENAPATIRDNYVDAYGYKLGDLRGVMSIKLPMDKMRAEATSRWQREFGIRAAGYIALLLLLGFMMRRLVVAPVHRLRFVTRRIGKGELDARADVAGDDEIADLARSVNDMAHSLGTHEEEIARLNHIYSALSETNHTIVRVEDEAELIRRICQIAVDFGGLKMAWFASYDPTGNRLVPLVSFGEGKDYATDLVIPLDESLPQGRGPTATAFRSGQPVIVQDYFAEALTGPWHERARPHGWGSAAAFPVVRDGRAQLVLNLYHTQTGAFDAKVIDLLSEMAMDIGYALDRIDLARAEEHSRLALMESEARYRTALETTQDGFWLVDDAGHFLDVNDAYAAFSGYSRAELLTMSIQDIEANEKPDEVRRHIEALMRTGSDLFETLHRTKNGALKTVEISTSVSARDPIRFSVFIRDLSQRNEAQERIQRLSHFDVLTGLPNSSLFSDLVRQALGQAQRNREALALLYIDLDNFKHVNDTLSHRVGDLLLIDLTKRFQLALRAGDTLCRLGGDEFIVLLPHSAAEDAAHVAERLIHTSTQAASIEGNELVVTPSLGIALYPADGEDYETLLSKADTATHRAKQDGRATYRFFTAEMQRRSTRTLKLEAALRRALENRELSLNYQPQVDLREGCLVGVEALLRWRHPELGQVSPAEFIPVAESSGLILPIGEWVMRTAMQQLLDWDRQGLTVPVVAVNLSAVQFRKERLVQDVKDILAELGVPPARLEIELTESLMMDNPVAAVAVMDELHRAGIQLSIDDFGTGYSSLNYLKRFRIDKLKIDQSFVRDLDKDPEDEAIVRAIISLAESLRFRTIAEGVETEAQLDFLRAAGCQEVQGYLFARPMPAAELPAWLGSWQPSRANGNARGI